MPSQVDLMLGVFNMQNVSVIHQPENPYAGKVPAGVIQDKALYYSELGTPVLSDITLGDRVNGANNTWMDSAGVERSFEPVTMAAVLLTVAQQKKIVSTEIQGRDGTVKEYIGLGDFEIAINGIITGKNGVHPREVVRQLKNVLDAPVAIVVSSWYLQNLDVHNVVVSSYEIGQEEGGYSYQKFTIRCLSDAPFELKVI